MSEIYNVGAVSNVKEKNILEQNNMLGLFIAYNSYKNEIIDNTMYTKGGDGGCSLCGGDGAIYVLPCYTAFYRYPVHTHSEGCYPQQADNSGGSSAIYLRFIEHVVKLSFCD